MAESPGERIDEERARAIWHRAAQLQAEATQRLEERSRRLAGEDGGDARLEGDLDPADVEAAAVEAGISPEFVKLAFAEQRGTVQRVKELGGWQDRAASRFLDTRERSVEVTRLIPAEPSRVLEAMRHVFPTHPYLLTLRDTIGEDPLDGGILVFDVPSYVSTYTTSFAYHMAWADLRQLRVMLRPVPVADAVHTEVLVSVDLRYGVRLNWYVGTGLSGFLGAGSGTVAAVVGGGILGAVAPAFALAGALLGFGAATAAVGGLSAFGYRKLFRYGIRKGVTEIDKLLQLVEVQTRMGVTFPLPDHPGGFLRGSGRGGTG